MIAHLNECFLCKLALVFALACILAGCATAQVGPCSKYPCEWSKPLVKGKMGVPKPEYTDTAKMYLCLEPTRQYPVMPSVNCI